MCSNDSRKFQVREWRGIAEGWLEIGQPRQFSEANRFAVLVGRIRPEMHHKVLTVSDF